MANDSLHAALQEAGLAPDDLAHIVQVDVRTVRRWLSGGTPYSRQRAKVARALDTPEHDLWPEIATVAPPPPPAIQTSDLLAGYTSASDPDAPDWHVLMRDATTRIELLGDTLIEVLGTAGVSELLATKASHGCEIRILIYDPHQDLPPDHPGIEIRRVEPPAAYTIHRFDDQLLLALHAVGGETDDAPLIHFHRASPEGMFDRLTDYYSDLWNHESQPLGGLELPPQQDPDEDDTDADPPLPAGERPASDSDRSAPSPRRWPRRPEGLSDRG